MKEKKEDDCSCSLSDDDLRAALIEMKTYVDVTEDDLKKIYEIALRHARRQKTQRIPVRNIMTKRVVTVSPEADLHEAARLLSEHKISGMPVVDKSNRVVGVVSQADILLLAGMQKEHTFKDILRKLLGEPIPTQKNGETVKDVMSFPPITSKADDELGEVAQILDERRIKRLPVVDDEGKLIGIIARADIIRLIGKA